MEKYKLKWITLNFPRDLSEHEENILIVNLQAVQNSTRDGLQGAYEKLNRKRFEYMGRVPGIREGLNYLKIRIASLIANTDDFFCLKKSNKHTYHFGYAWEDLKAINAQFKVVNRTLKLPEPSLVNEMLLIEGIKAKVLPDMGFTREQVKISVSENAP